MALDLLNLSSIASTAITVRPIARVMNAMATTQSNLSANQSNQSPIELADAAQRRLFVVSVIFGVVAALIAALLALLLWRANNAHQAAAKADADARIAEAGESAARANAEAVKANEGLKGAEARIEEARAETAKASEEVARLTTEAEALRADAERARANIAAAQADAAQAKAQIAEAEVRIAEVRKEAAAEAGRIKIDLESQKERAARAESRLEAERLTRLELEESLNPRYLTIVQTGDEENIDPLKVYAGTKVKIESLPDAEPRRMAVNLARLLERAGWSVAPIELRADINDPFQNGVVIDSGPWGPGKTNAAADVLRAFLTVNGIQSGPLMSPEAMREMREGAPPRDSLTISVSLKPDPYFRDKSTREFFKRLGEQDLKLFDESREHVKRVERERAEKLLEELRHKWRSHQTKPKQD